MPPQKTAPPERQGSEGAAPIKVSSGASCPAHRGRRSVFCQGEHDAPMLARSGNAGLAVWKTQSAIHIQRTPRMVILVFIDVGPLSAEGLIKNRRGVAQATPLRLKVSVSIQVFSYFLHRPGQLGGSDRGMCSIVYQAIEEPFTVTVTDRSPTVSTSSPLALPAIATPSAFRFTVMSSSVTLMLSTTTFSTVLSAVQR